MSRACRAWSRSGIGKTHPEYRAAFIAGYKAALAEHKLGGIDVHEKQS